MAFDTYPHSSGKRMAFVSDMLQKGMITKDQYQALFVAQTAVERILNNPTETKTPVSDREFYAGVAAAACALAIRVKE